MIRGQGAAWLYKRAAPFGGLNGGGDGGNAAVRHGLTLRQTLGQRVVFLGAITVLLGGIVEETPAASKVGGIVGGATGVAIGAEKGLGHGKFVDEGVGDGFAVGQGASADVHVARWLGNVLGGGTPGVEGLIEGAKGGFLIDGGGVTAGRINRAAGGEDHVLRRERCSDGRCAGDVLFTDFDPGTEFFGQGHTLLRENVTEHLGGVPVGLETHGWEKIALHVLKRVLTDKGRGSLTHY